MGIKGSRLLECHRAAPACCFRYDHREEQTSQVVLHTDQGAVYSSWAFCQVHHDCNILHSMSRGGTPTDNPIIEAFNSWIKEELYLDFALAHTNNVPVCLEI